MLNIYLYNIEKLYFLDTDKPPTVEIEVDSCGGDPNARRKGHKIRAKVVWPVPGA